MEFGDELASITWAFLKPSKVVPVAFQTSTAERMISAVKKKEFTESTLVNPEQALVQTSIPGAAGDEESAGDGPVGNPNDRWGLDKPTPWH